MRSPSTDPRLGALACACVALLSLGGCDDAATPSPAKVTDSAVATHAIGPIEAAAKWGAGGGDAVDPTRSLAGNWYLVDDGSGSMASSQCSSGRPGGRETDAKEAIKSFVSRIPAADNVGLYVFDDVAWDERVALGSGPSNRAAVYAAIRGVVAGNNTPLGESLEKGLAALQAQAKRQGGYGTYHLVVVTDGEPTGYDAMGRLRRAVDAVAATPVVLETIGFCIDEPGHPLNRPGVTVYRDAQDPASLARGLDAVLAETDAFAATGAPR